MIIVCSAYFCDLHDCIYISLKNYWTGLITRLNCCCEFLIMKTFCYCETVGSLIFSFMSWFLNRLKCYFNLYMKINRLTDFEYDYVAAVIKDFLSELPEPLCTHSLLTMFMDTLSVQVLGDAEGNAKLMLGVIECLPKTHQVFSVIVFHCLLPSLFISFTVYELYCIFAWMLINVFHF